EPDRVAEPAGEAHAALERERASRDGEVSARCDDAHEPRTGGAGLQRAADLSPRDEEGADVEERLGAGRDAVLLPLVPAVAALDRRVVVVADEAGPTGGGDVAALGQPVPDALGHRHTQLREVRGERHRHQRGAQEVAEPAPGLTGDVPAPAPLLGVVPDERRRTGVQAVPEAGDTVA